MNENEFQTGVTVIRETVKNLPSKPGVYRMLDDEGKALYVGKAKHLKNRVTNYTTASGLSRRIMRMISQTRVMEITTTHTEAEALLLEARMIRQLQPRYNILLRDDKSFPYIEFTNHEFPQIRKHRGNRKKNCNYFGPFPSASAVNHTLTILQRAFLLRPCNDSVFKNRSRPCLQYQIKRCSAPCVNMITNEDYKQLLGQAQDFLQGKNRAIQKNLSEQMQSHSEAMEFEKAAELRDRIKALTQIQQNRAIALADVGDTDVIVLVRQGRHTCIEVFCYRGGQAFGNQHYFPRHAEEQDDASVMSGFIGQFYQSRTAPAAILVNQLPEEPNLTADALSLDAPKRVQLHQPQRGDKKSLIDQALLNAQRALENHITARMSEAKHLEGVAKLFGLDASPQRIEVYDNSHIAGQYAIGAMIVAGTEGLMKNQYRRFNIRNAELTPGDDYGMMREVFTRRFKRLQKEDPDKTKGMWPDLVLIDGGLGQLNTVMEVCEECGVTGVPLVGVAKGPDRNAGREEFYLPRRSSFQLPPGDSTLHYIQRLRDEAHRFAIGSHRIKRSKAIHKSALDDIPGVGATRKKALLHHFGSAKAVERASLAELQKVEGINRKTAEVIYNYFQS